MWEALKKLRESIEACEAAVWGLLLKYSQPPLQGLQEDVEHPDPPVPVVVGCPSKKPQPKHQTAADSPPEWRALGNLSGVSNWLPIMLGLYLIQTAADFLLEWRDLGIISFGASNWPLILLRTSWIWEDVT